MNTLERWVIVSDEFVRPRGKIVTTETSPAFVYIF